MQWLLFSLFKTLFKKGRDLWARQIECFMYQILVLIAPNICYEYNTKLIIYEPIKFIENKYTINQIIL